MGIHICLTKGSFLVLVCRISVIIHAPLLITCGAVDWMDAGRDILNFLVNYLPATTTPSSLPTHLPRVSITESEARKVNGYTDRTLVVVGHSYGGCAS